MNFYGKDYNFVAPLIPSYPLRSSANVISCIESFVASDVETYLSGFEFGWMKASIVVPSNLFLKCSNTSFGYSMR